MIHEKFGDGIMSMIDCKVTVDRKPDPKGDRVVLTFECVAFHSRDELLNIQTLITFLVANSCLTPSGRQMYRLSRCDQFEMFKC